MRLFLLHAFPKVNIIVIQFHLTTLTERHTRKVRTEAAEDLYLVMQARDLGFDTDEAEEILLDTDW